MMRKRSLRLLEEYGDVVPGGVHSNFRSPVYYERAKGSRVWDVDGNEYIDCVVSNGACILGHGDPDISEAVGEVLEYGLSVGLEGELGLKVARLVKEMVPSAERVRFANTGTEAMMKAVMIAREHTGRGKIVKAEGAYHGWYDDFLVSVHPDPKLAGPPNSPLPVRASGGLRRDVEDWVVPVPFNDPEALDRALSLHGDDVAAVIVEPVVFNSGCIPPKDGYLEAVREVTHKHDVVLIFDEVITGFRLAPGGAQELYGVVPDLTVLAKAIANGYPLAAVVGRRDLMEVTHPAHGRVLYAGTYNAHHVALAAASVCLEKLRDGGVQRRLRELTERLVEGFGRLADKLGVKARLQGIGGQFQVYFTDEEVVDYRSAAFSDEWAYRRFQGRVLREGVLMKPSYLFHHGVTYSHTEEDIDRILEAMEKGLEAVRDED
ncbi:MAG TPA: aspartate aminotransferase family protein [Candidatus Latescibacteria bacterium]|nr:aspartate aminotransferase family protein [Candidatus Latescibacterota bacterium]